MSKEDGRQGMGQIGYPETEFGNRSVDLRQVGTQDLLDSHANRHLKRTVLAEMEREIKVKAGFLPSQGAKQDPHWTSWSSNSYGRMARRTMKQRPRCTSECYTRLCRKRKVQTAHRRRMTCTMQTFMCSAKCGRTLSRWNACVQNLLRSTPPFASPRPHLSMTATMEPWCEPLEVPICMILPLWE